METYVVLLLFLPLRDLMVSCLCVVVILCVPLVSEWRWDRRIILGVRGRCRWSVRVIIIRVGPVTSDGLEVGHLDEIDRGRDDRADRAIGLCQSNDRLQWDVEADHLIPGPVPDLDVGSPVGLGIRVEKVRPHAERSRGAVPLHDQVGGDPGDTDRAKVGDVHVHGRDHVVDLGVVCGVGIEGGSKPLSDIRGD